MHGQGWRVTSRLPQKSRTPTVTHGASRAAAPAHRRIATREGDATHAASRKSPMTPQLNCRHCALRMVTSSLLLEGMHDKSVHRLMSCAGSATALGWHHRAPVPTQRLLHRMPLCCGGVACIAICSPKFGTLKRRCNALIARLAGPDILTGKVTRDLPALPRSSCGPRRASDLKLRTDAVLHL